MPSSASVSSGSQKFHSWAISCLTMAYSQSRQDQECSWVGNDTKDYETSQWFLGIGVLLPSICS
jgi:hypothetical protein